MHAAEPEPKDLPLFIGATDGSVVNYTYFGDYRSPRWSDTLGYNEFLEVPLSVRHFHASELSKLDRPGWLHEAMKDHFWPAPDTLSMEAQMREEFEESYDREAEPWMENLTKETILECFDEVDHLSPFPSWHCTS